MKWALYERLRGATAAGASAAVVTRLGDGAQSLFDGERWEGGLELDRGATGCRAPHAHRDRSGMLAGAENLFVRSYARPPRLIVVGAAHISQFLAPMAALAGFEVIVIDPRRAFASAERFPGVTLIDDWPDEAFERLKLDATSAVVTLTHDPKIDDPALDCRARKPRVLCRRAGQQAHACQACCPAHRSGARRQGRAHPFTGGARPRRTGAARDRGFHSRRGGPGALSG